MKKRTVAVIDLGTNTFHILVAHVDASLQYQIIYRERIPVMIGKSGINQGIITEEAQERTLDALRRFQAIIAQCQVQEVHATATSAFRNAKNGQALADRILTETGIEVNIIDGSTEAEYIFQGVRKAVNLPEEPVLVMDIGGGSVEFIIGRRHEVLWKQSFEIGAQRLLDRFAIQDPIAPENIQDLFAYFEETLYDLIQVKSQFQPQILVGASGTFDTLNDMYTLRAAPPITTPTSPPIPYESFLKILDELSRKNRAERLLIPGMLEMRVDMIVVASWLIKFVLDQFNVTHIEVSNYALKEGVLNSVIQAG